MTDIILTHGFFLAEDSREQEIMRPYPPLGLLYISAWLRGAGFAPEICDTTFRTRESFESRLRAGDCRILGIYTTHVTRSSVVRQIRFAKSLGCTVVLGGPDSANYPGEYLARGADIVVIGEGEAALAELLPLLARGAPAAGLADVGGLVYRDAQGALARTGPRAYLEIDTIPWPDRLHIDMDAYMEAWRSRHGETSLTMITSRGCRYQCRWCSHAVFGNAERRRDPEDCADEARWLGQRYGPDQLWFADDVFTMDHSWLLRFSDALRRRGVRIPFECISRADRMQDPATVGELARMGCRRVWIGSESGSDRILRAMRRGVTSRQVVRATRLARRCGIETGMFLMWGYEGETPEDIEATIRHVEAAGPDVFFTTVAYPIRGTPYYGDIRHKLALPEDWATASDKDLEVLDRKPPAYFQAADRWLRHAIKAKKTAKTDPEASVRHARLAADARRQTWEFWHG